MNPLLSIVIRQEHDIVAARQRARQVAELLGLDRIEQTRIATAVSEVARNAFTYAGGGRVDYSLEGNTPPQLLVITTTDRGPGIPHLDAVLSGEYQSPSGMGIGLVGARRLMDRFSIDSTPRGTTVKLSHLLPKRSPFLTAREQGQLMAELATKRYRGPMDELQEQNRELARALEVVQTRQEEIERINRELEDTNRGVVALYAELDERADHLRRADELKTKFLSNMTHEFRTPVNSILALTQLLAERLQVGDQDKNELFYIRKAAQQLSDLVDDLLDIAKVEAGKVEVRPAHFEVAGLFGALRGMLRPLLAGVSVRLVFEDPTDVPPIYSDESKVSQILRNFVSNALKYTERGEVVVAATLRRDENAVEFSVRDTGIGIPESELPRIFDEFVQIENPLQKRVKGTGLGLPLSRRLAELLGGRISVESRLGEGSTFTVTVPILFRQPRAAVQKAEPTPGQLPVLVVEDSDEDVLMYQRFFTGTQFQLFHAETTDAAQALMEQVTFAAVVLDIRLHGSDSWEWLSRTKRSSATSEVPFVVISTVDDRRKAFGLGASAVGLKPVTRDWLLRTLETLTQPEASLRVLAIDDHEAFRFVIRESLSSRLYEYVEAATGEEGWSLVRSFRPDVVLLDLQLPDISGADWVRRLRADDELARTPVIVVTSNRVSGEDWIATHVAAVLSKANLTRESLRSAVRDAVLSTPPLAQVPA